MTIDNSQDTVLDLLCAEPDRLEVGLVLVDRQLRLGHEALVDVLCRDSLGFPVAVLLSTGDVAADLARMARMVAAFHEGRFLLDRLFKEEGFDANQRPRFVLLAQRFPDAASQQLNMLTQVEIHALEYRIVQSSVGRSVLDLQSFHRTAAPGVSADSGPRPEQSEKPSPTASKPSAAALPDIDKSLSAEEPEDLFNRAQHDIEYLSDRVDSDQKSEDLIHFTVEGQLLAIVEREDTGVALQIGSDETGRISVTDDEGYHDQLSRVFTNFFDNFAPEEIDS